MAALLVGCAAADASGSRLCSQYEPHADFSNLTWPYLRDVALGAREADACEALRARGPLLAEVHGSAVRRRQGCCVL